MTMLIQLQNGVPTGYPVLDSNFRQLYPNTSFPAILTPETVEPFDCGLYDFSGQPTPGKYEKVVEAAPVKNSSGVWIQSWAVVAMNDAEKAQADADKENQVRADRNGRLSVCDWTQLPDSPADKTAWATYRQELRDVTKQAGFPWDVIWPVAP